MSIISRLTIFSFLGLILSLELISQAVYENGKWGYKSNNQWIIPPSYDTIMGFDSTQTVCMSCLKFKNSNNSKFIKVTSTSFVCNYYNMSGKKLIGRNQFNDTFSVFSYNKNVYNNYMSRSAYFVANVKKNKYLFTKDFKQLTFNEYYDIRPTACSNFYIAQIVNDLDVPVTGLVNKIEQKVIPFQYSEIVINTLDSLIIACSAGINAVAPDEVYNYEGKKVQSSSKHIDLATKNFLVHKIFEPKEHFLIYNIGSKQETPLKADEVAYWAKDEILIRIKNEWFIYDMQTNLKRPKNKT